ncbi:MAG: pseudouridine synthase [Bacteriovoracaceae bacterium]
MEKRLISNKSEVSFLKEHGSIEEALLELLPISKNKLKKNLPKNFLQKKVRAKDTVELSLDVLNHGMINPMYLGPEVQVLYEDDLLLVFNKPAKIHSHPLSYLESDNLLSFVRSHFSDQLLMVNRTEYDRGLLFRLDYETSGLMCYIKQEALYQELRYNFAKVAKKKTYLGLVKGRFTSLGLHQHGFTAIGEKGSRQKVSIDGGDFLGELAVLKSDYDDKTNTSLLTIELMTGLRHQIRAQLSFLGFPLIGDDLYGGEKAHRLFLHAFEYAFETRTLRYDFLAELPSDFIFSSRSL